MIVDPGEMTLSLFKEKLLKVQNYCQEIFEKAVIGCHRLRTVGPWSIEEKKFHMNVAKLRAVKLAIMSFTLREKNAILVQIRMGKMTVLSYLMKM